MHENAIGARAPLAHSTLTADLVERRFLDHLRIRDMREIDERSLCAGGMA